VNAHTFASSNRRAVPELTAARPMLTMLPAIFHEDPFAIRWLAAFDDVMTAIDTTLDCFPAYIDPALSPTDFLEWIGSWLGAEPDEEMSETQRRSLVAALVDLHARRGTAGAIRELVELQLPVHCEVIEGGGSQASLGPGGPLPGTAASIFLVRITAIGATLSDHQRRRARLIIDAARPAHLPVSIEFPETVKDHT
jgi:phage tail-like protein